MKQHCAVYQAGGPVYGVGESPEAAETNAQPWLDEDDTPIVRYARTGGQGEVEGQLSCRPCSVALASDVEANGGDVVYAICDGMLCLAAELDEPALTLDLDPDEEASFGPGNPADYGDR